MATETLQTKVIVDANQAVAEISKFNEETKRTLSAVEQVDRKINQYEKDIDDLSSAIVKGGRNTAAYQQQLRALERELDALEGKTKKGTQASQAFSSSGASAAGGARNFGMAALEASRAVEDLQYGVSGVINNIPSLVMALGGKAGLAGILSLAAVGVYQLVKAFTSVEPAVKDAVDKSKEELKSLDDKIMDIRQSIRELEVGSFFAAFETEQKKLAETTQKIRDGLKAWGGDIERFKSQSAVGVGGTKEQIASAQELVDAYEKQDTILKSMVKERGLTLLKQQEEDNKKSVESYRKLVDDLRGEIGETITGQYLERDLEQWTPFSKWAEEEAQKAKKALEELEEIRGAQGGYFLKMQKDVGLESPEDRERIQKEVEKQAEIHAKRMAEIQGNSWAERMAFQDLANEESLDQIGKMTSFEYQQLQERLANNKEVYQGISDAATSAFGIMTSGFSRLTADIITGQEHAAERFAVLTMQQAGQSLISSGTKLAGKAVESALTPGMQGLAVVQGAAAAGLIASGIGLGGVAAGIEHMVAGGTIGKPLPDKKSSRDRGASPRTPRDTGEGGGLVINVSYGVAGPLPEDTARAIAKAQKTGNRRGAA